MIPSLVKLLNVLIKDMLSVVVVFAGTEIRDPSLKAEKLFAFHFTLMSLGKA